MSSRESSEQGKAGRRGAESAQAAEGPGGQPRQGSGRVEQRRDEEPEHRFGVGRKPSEQGEMEHRSAGVIAQNQQGFAGGGTGASGSRGGDDRSEEEATEGAPSGDHTRHGRQQTPGDRNREEE